MNIPRTRLILFGVIGGVVLLILLVLFGVLPGLRGGNGVPPVGTDVTLEVWGVFDDEDVLVDSFDRAAAGATIEYRRLDEATYEEDLIAAFASGKAPDVFMFHNSWLPKFVDKIVPAPETLVSTLDMDRFPTTVMQDFAPDGKVYALPLYLDTLALFYNKDIFDRAAIAGPPATWADFERIVPRLRTMTRNGDIERAAAAIGGSEASVNRATDLLSLIMLQTGTRMTDDDFTVATFDGSEGQDAFRFYLSFANPAEREKYTWNDGLTYSLDAFAEEKVAVIFNYAHQLKALRERSPFLRVGVAPVPQPSEATDEVNYPNYWGFAVSSQSAHPDAAWNFIANLTTDPDTMKLYLETAGRPPALRTLIEEHIGNPDWDVFARQALSARSWPQVDNTEIERIFSEAIRNVLTGRFPPEVSLNRAKEEVNTLMERRAERSERTRPVEDGDGGIQIDF